MSLSQDDLRTLLGAAQQVLRFDEQTRAWHAAPTAFDDLTDELHRANFDLWHLEDRARDPLATDAVIADVKRAIDTKNQSRNDLVERVDDQLMHALSLRNLPNPVAALHSETPGMMLDRLSILSLKRFHTGEEATRESATPEHRQRNVQRLAVLDTQSAALVGCLQAVWDEVCAGTRRFAVYRQMKMYNDPTLNPVLYSATERD